MLLIVHGNLPEPAHGLGSATVADGHRPRARAASPVPPLRTQDSGPRKTPGPRTKKHSYLVQLLLGLPARTSRRTGSDGSGSEQSAEDWADLDGPKAGGVEQYYDADSYPY